MEVSSEPTQNPSDNPSSSCNPRGTASPAAKASRLPEKFFVSAEMQDWARREVPHVDWKAETAKFCDHWRAESGQRARKLDWVAAWRNWLRRSSERSTNGRNGHGRPVGIDAVAEYARQEGLT